MDSTCIVDFASVASMRMNDVYPLFLLCVQGTATPVIEQFVVEKYQILCVKKINKIVTGPLQPTSSSNRMDEAKLRAILTRLSYGLDCNHGGSYGEIKGMLETYIKRNKEADLSTTILQPTLELITSNPRRAPFQTLSTLFSALQDHNNEECVQSTVSICLAALLICSATTATTTSPSYWTALQACLSLSTQTQHHTTTTTTIDKVLGRIIEALDTNGDAEHRIGALTTLSALLLAPHTPSPSSMLMDLAAVVVQRISLFDSSPNVRSTAVATLRAFSTTTAMTTTATEPQHNDDDQNTNSSSIYFQMSPPPSETMPTPSLSGPPSSSSRHHEKSPLAALAMAPLPDFSPPSPSQSVFESSHPEASASAEAEEAELEEIKNFLRGSIVSPWAVPSHPSQTPKNDDDMEDMFSEGWSDGLLPSSHVAAIRGDYASLLRSAIQRVHDYDDTPLDTCKIESILQRVLDLHSERLYEMHTNSAEEALVRKSQTAKDDVDGLERYAETLEQQVHILVAQEHAEFMERVLPVMADMLASTPMAQLMENI